MSVKTSPRRAANARRAALAVALPVRPAAPRVGAAQHDMKAIDLLAALDTLPTAEAAR
jgi:hypothetical protein